MFERFTYGGRRIVVVAQEQARVQRHASIGSEHLLLAILHLDDGVAPAVFRARGVSEVAVRAEVDRVVGSGSGMPEGHMPFTQDAKNALERSLREAMGLRHRSICSDHIALALTDERDTVAAQALQALAVDPAQLRDDLLARADEFDLGPATGFSSSAVLATGPSPWRAPALPEARAASVHPLGCSLCGRSARSATRLVVAFGTVICDACIRSMSDLLDEAGADGPTTLRYRPPERAPAERDAAVAAIERAFSVVFGALRGGVDEQVAVIEDGPELRTWIEEWERAVAPLRPRAVDVTVERVRFVAEQEAEIALGIWLQGNTRSPMIRPARSVAVDGEWKVGRDTVARFASMTGVRFPSPPGH